MRGFPKTLLVLFALAAGGCASVTVTPKTISAIPGREQDRAAALKNLREAVEIVNLFLASDFRKTLPVGKIVLEDDSLTFVTADKTLPVRIRCANAGDILIPFHMAAQERADGFVVGLVAPRQRREIDNSLFKDPSGAVLPNYVVALTILHELTHSWFGVGTVSFPKTVAYYAEAIFLFRYGNHSMERLPFQTSHEVEAFIRSKAGSPTRLRFFPKSSPARG